MTLHTAARGTWEPVPYVATYPGFVWCVGGGARLPSLGGAIPAAAAPRHRHHSPHNEPRVRREGWAARVGLGVEGKKPCSDTSCLHGHVCAPDLLRLLRWADEVSSFMEIHTVLSFSDFTSIYPSICYTVMYLKVMQTYSNILFPWSYCQGEITREMNNPLTVCDNFCHSTSQFHAVSPGDDT